MVKLSDIDTSVYYPITIPSTKKETVFRPFKVREERALLMAQQSEDAKTMLSTLEAIVRSCVKDTPEQLTTFDAEYLFVHMRAKSVGETSDAVSTCTHCDHKNNIQIDLTTVKMSNDFADKKIVLSDDLTVIMRYPTIGQISELVSDSLNKEEQAIAAAIESVYYKDTVFHMKENDAFEITEFILNRTDSEMDKLVQFIESIPSAMIESKYICEGCGKENVVRIEGISDFF